MSDEKDTGKAIEQFLHKMVDEWIDGEQVSIQMFEMFAKDTIARANKHAADPAKGLYDFTVSKDGTLCVSAYIYDFDEYELDLPSETLDVIVDRFLSRRSGLNGVVPPQEREGLADAANQLRALADKLDPPEAPEGV